MPGKNPFKVPENYFDEVTRKILSDSVGYDHEGTKTGFNYRFRTYLAIAATVAGLVFLTYEGVKLLTPGRTGSQVSELIIEENTDSYINDIDLLTLEENASLPYISEEGSGASKNDIIDYLLLENIEIADIYQQL
jgi:hypothetical protein